MAPKRLRRLILTPAVALAMVVALAYPRAADACIQGAAFDHVQTYGYGYAGRAWWTIAPMQAADLYIEGTVNQAIWVGTNGGSFVATPTVGSNFVEVGVVRGWHATDPSMHYYTAMGRNYIPAVSGEYAQINLNTDPRVNPKPPLPVVGETHQFGVNLSTAGDGWAAPLIDYSAYWLWPNHPPPVYEFGVGYEATCIDHGATKVGRMPVTPLQWADGAYTWYDASNGSWRVLPDIGPDARFQWCSYPTWFVAALRDIASC